MRRDHFGQVQELPPKLRAVIRFQSTQTQDYVSAPPTSRIEQRMEEEIEEEMKELSYISSAVSEPRWAL